jgi:predicted metalloprotease with PDZ domain
MYRPIPAGVLVAALLVLTSTPAFAQDERFPGVILLDVDVSDVDRRIFRVRETIPAHAGRLELYYPQWIPGEHTPSGPIQQLAGLRFRVNGQQQAWLRDPLDVFKFVLNLPAGTREVQIEFQAVTPQASAQGPVVVTSSTLGLSWNQVVLYPAGYKAMDIPVRATLQLPAGWKYASAMRPDAQRGDAGPDKVTFETVPLEVLVDSPLFAGRHSRSIDVTPRGSPPPVQLEMISGRASDLAASDEQIGLYRAMVRETYAALGAPRYDRFDFLLILSDNFGIEGLEHHRSSENSLKASIFRNWDDGILRRYILPHEYMHSWIGKYRRPARLWTPAFNTPMQDDLLWVYEGLTEYYSRILTARSGLWPQDFARDNVAALAAKFDVRTPGREWRPLLDTTHDGIINRRQPMSWASWQRSEDYYDEGALLWLDVDMRLRDMTKGKRSLDDFANAFLAAPATHGWVSTYEFADVVRALNVVAPMDWGAFLRERLDGTRQPVLNGVERAGFQLVYNDQPNKLISASEKAWNYTNLGYSLGLQVGNDGALSEVLWEGPAFKAGLTNGARLIAVNGRAFSAEVLKDATSQASKDGPLVELMVQDQDDFRTVRIDYRGGLRYPHLEPVAGKPDGLGAILAPRAPTP